MSPGRLILNIGRVGLPALAGLALAACDQPARALSPMQREAIQSRVTHSFAGTVLFSPAEAESNLAPDFRLAPLIVQEVVETNGRASWRDQFAAGGSEPLVLAETGTVAVNGRSHDQFSYHWNYSGAPAGLDRQGIRITLNATGEPVIWEVLHDSSGADIVYVAQSLELAARAEFGPPLPGRKYSIERRLTETPNTVVANVIDDGPLPMGPVVYLRARTRDVSTLICRCMASQGGTLLGQTNYQLDSAPSATPQLCPGGALETRLRIPASL